MWRTVCGASLCSALGHMLLILNHQQVQWSLAPVVYRLWNSHLYATSVKQLTSCLWHCTSLGTIKHESREWDPHGEDRENRLLAVQRGKTYSPPLLPSVCPGVLKTLVWCHIGENWHGFILCVWTCEKNVFGKRILKSLVCSFCFICKSQRENCRSAYLVFRSYRGLMMLQRSWSHTAAFCCVNFFVVCKSSKSLATRGERNVSLLVSCFFAPLVKLLDPHIA